MDPQSRKARGIVTINTERCKGCGFCVEFCPTGVLALSQEFNNQGYHYPIAQNVEACSGCDQCGAYCPDFAIFGTRFKKESATAKS